MNNDTSQPEMDMAPEPNYQRYIAGIPLAWYKAGQINGLHDLCSDEPHTHHSLSCTHVVITDVPTICASNCSFKDKEEVTTNARFLCEACFGYDMVQSHHDIEERLSNAYEWYAENEPGPDSSFEQSMAEMYANSNDQYFDFADVFRGLRNGGRRCRNATQAELDAIMFSQEFIEAESSEAVISPEHTRDEVVEQSEIPGERAFKALLSGHVLRSTPESKLARERAFGLKKSHASPRRIRGGDDNDLTPRGGSQGKRWTLYGR